MAPLGGMETCPHQPGWHCIMLLLSMQVKLNCEAFAQRQHSGKVDVAHVGPCILLGHHLVISMAGQSLVPTGPSQPSIHSQNAEGSQILEPQGPAFNLFVTQYARTTRNITGLSVKQVAKQVWPANIIRCNL